MSNRKTQFDRRKVLAATGGLALSGVGSVQGSPDNSPGKGPNGNPGRGPNGNPGKKPDSSSTDNGTIAIDNESSGKKEEWEEMIEERRASRPNIVDSSDDIFTQTAAGSNPTTENLEYEDHWKSESDTTLNCDLYRSDYETEGEHVLTIYKAVDNSGNHLTDSSGDYRYIIELWSQQEKTSSAGFLCPEGAIQEVHWELDSSSSRTVFHGRDPISKERINDERLPVSYEYSVGGVTYGSTDVVRVDDGVFGAESWTPGEAGQYQIIWEGEEDLVDIIGFVDVATSCKINLDGGCSTGLSWGWSVSTDW